MRCAVGAAAGRRWMTHGMPPMPPMPPYDSPPSVQQSGRLPKEPSEYIKNPPVNFGINIVPQGQLWVAERLGKYHTTLNPGVSLLIPLVDRIAYCFSSKEQGYEIPDQAAITKDNVQVHLDGILFLKITDPKCAAYNIDNPIYNLINVAQTAMRSEIGKLTLDRLFEERKLLNDNIRTAIQKDSEGWGVECRRYEIKDILVSDIVRKSMDLQAEADRKRRKSVLESEGDRDAMANRARGDAIAIELKAEAERIAVVKRAEAEAEQLRLLADARADSIGRVAKALEEAKCSEEAVRLDVAKQYISSFEKLAKETNTVILPANVGDPSGMIASALGVYSALGRSQPPSPRSTADADSADAGKSEQPSPQAMFPASEAPPQAPFAQPPPPPFNFSGA